MCVCACVNLIINKHSARYTSNKMAHLLPCYTWTKTPTLNRKRLRELKTKRPWFWEILKILLEFRLNVRPWSK